MRIARVLWFIGGSRPHYELIFDSLKAIKRLV